MDVAHMKMVAEKRQAVCFVCKWILEDLNENGRLTGYPYAYDGHSIFPIPGKIRHLELEVGSFDTKPV